MKKRQMLAPSWRAIAPERPQWRPLADLARAAGSGLQDREAAPTSREHLRRRFFLALELRLTQENYVDWLRNEPDVDRQCLAEEEAFLVCLQERVLRAQAALKESAILGAGC